MVARLRVALAGRYRMLEREAAKTALDLNVAATELKALSDAGRRKGEGAGAAAGAVLRDGVRAHRSAQAARRTARGSRAHARPAENPGEEIGAIEQRLTQGEKEAQDLEKRFELAAAGTGRAFAEAGCDSKSRREAARALSTAKNEERETLQGMLRERERVDGSARQQVLRLLGEASTLKNQLAQIDQYLPASSATRRASTKEAEGRRANSSAGMA